MNRKLFLILILLPFFGFSQKDTIAHLHTFGSLANDLAEDIAITNDGGVIVVGSTASGGDGNTDIYLLKIDSSCNFKWSYALGGTNNDWGYAIKQTHDNGFILAASSNSYGDGGYDAVLLKRDSLGNYQWQKNYGGNDWDFAYDVIQTFDSGYVFCGETYSNTNGYSDVYVVKTNAFGDTLWTKKVGGNLIDKGNSVVQTSDSSILVAGIKNTSTDSTQAYVLKFDKDGTLLWDSVFGGVKYDVANSIIETSDGSYVFVGTSDSFGTTNNDCFITKISTDGILLWQNYFAMPQDDGAYDVFELTNGDLLVAGYTSSFGGGKKDALIFTATSGGWWAAKNSTFGGLENEIANKLVIDLKGNMYMSGYTNSFGEGLNDVMIIRVDTIVKQQQFTITNNNDEAPIGIEKNIIQNNVIKVFPNPTKETFQIVHNRQSIDMQIFDVLGNKVIDKQFINPQEIISVSKLPRGFYSLVFMKNGEVLHTEKLILIE